MNIFVLDYDPTRAAVSQCDKHVVKMVLETAQILCAIFEPGEAPYRRTHYNHPCTIWSRESIQNFNWTVDHGKALAAEYTYRYGKRHKSQDVIEWCDLYQYRLNLPKIGLTPFALAMPEKYRSSNPVQSYRDYYIGEKMNIAQWNKSRTMPDWVRKEVKNATS